MAQIRHVGRTGRVVVTSTAVLALSLATYGSMATAITPTRPQVGARQATDLGVPSASSAVGVHPAGPAKVEHGVGKPTDAKPGPAVAQDCVVGVATADPPDVLPTGKSTGSPAVTAKTDPSTGTGSAGPLPSTRLLGAPAGKPGQATVAVPELREDPNGGKRFVTPQRDACSAIEPPVQVKRPPTGPPEPVVEDEPPVPACADPATDPRMGGGAPAQSEPGSSETDARGGDQPADLPTCVPAGGDEPGTDGGDPGPAVDLPVSVGDAREGLQAPTR